MGRRKIFVKIIAILLVITFSCQNILWADPDLASGRKYSLQVQSVSNPLVYPAIGHKALIEFHLRGLMKSLKKNSFNIRDARDHLFPVFTHNGKDVMLHLRFDEKGEDQGKLRVPCTIEYDIGNDQKYSWQYEALIDPDDENAVSIRREAEREEDNAQEIFEEKNATDRTINKYDSKEIEEDIVELLTQMEEHLSKGKFYKAKQSSDILVGILEDFRDRTPEVIGRHIDRAVSLHNELANVFLNIGNIAEALRVARTSDMLMESFDRSKVSAKNIQYIIGNYNALAHTFLNKWVAGEDDTYLIKAESAANNSFEILTRYRDIKPGDPAEPDETVEDIQHLIKTYDRLAYPFRNKWLKEKDKVYLDKAENTAKAAFELLIRYGDIKEVRDAAIGHVVRVNTRLAYIFVQQSYFDRADRMFDNAVTLIKLYFEESKDHARHILPGFIKLLLCYVSKREFERAFEKLKIINSEVLAKYIERGGLTAKAHDMAAKWRHAASIVTGISKAYSLSALEDVLNWEKKDLGKEPGEIISAFYEARKKRIERGLRKKEKKEQKRAAAKKKEAMGLEEAFRKIRQEEIEREKERRNKAKQEDNNKPGGSEKGSAMITFLFGVAGVSGGIFMLFGIFKFSLIATVLIPILMMIVAAPLIKGRGKDKNDHDPGDSGQGNILDEGKLLEAKGPFYFKSSKFPMGQYRLEVERAAEKDHVNRKHLDLKVYFEDTFSGRSILAGFLEMQIAEDNLFILGWGGTLNYPELIGDFEKYRKGGFISRMLPFYDALYGYYNRLVENDSVHGKQVELILREAEKLQLEDDEEYIRIYLKCLGKNFEGDTVALAINEFISSYIPYGATVTFRVRHDLTVKSLAEGVKFEDTGFGRLFAANGFEFISERANTVSLKKTDNPLAGFRVKVEWLDEDRLGPYRVKTEEKKEDELLALAKRSFQSKKTSRVIGSLYPRYYVYEFAKALVEKDMDLSWAFETLYDLLEDVSDPEVREMVFATGIALAGAGIYPSYAFQTLRKIFRQFPTKTKEAELVDINDKRFFREIIQRQSNRHDRLLAIEDVLEGFIRIKKGLIDRIVSPPDKTAATHGLIDSYGTRRDIDNLAEILSEFEGKIKQQSVLSLAISLLNKRNVYPLNVYRVLRDILSELMNSDERKDAVLIIGKIYEEYAEEFIRTNEIFEDLDLEGLASGTQAYIKLLIFDEVINHTATGEFMEQIRNEVIPALRAVESISRQYPAMGMDMQVKVGRAGIIFEDAIEGVILTNYFSNVKTEHAMDKSGFKGRRDYFLKVPPTVYPIFSLMVNKLFRMGIIKHQYDYTLNFDGDYLKEASFLSVCLFFCFLPHKLRIVPSVADYKNVDSKAALFPGVARRPGVDAWTGKILDGPRKGAQTSFFHSVFASLIVSYSDDKSFLMEREVNLFELDIERNFLLVTGVAGLLEEYGVMDEGLKKIYLDNKSRIMKFLINRFRISREDIPNLFPETGAGLQYTSNGSSLGKVHQLMRQLKEYFRNNPAAYKEFQDIVNEMADQIKWHIFPEGSLSAAVIEHASAGEWHEVKKAIISAVFGHKDQKLALILLDAANYPEKDKILGALAKESDDASSSDGEKDPAKPDGSPLGIYNIMQKNFKDRRVSADSIRKKTKGRAADGHLSLDVVKRDLGTLVYLGFAERSVTDKGVIIYRATDLSPPLSGEDPLSILDSLGTRPTSIEKRAAKAKLVYNQNIVPVVTPFMEKDGTIEIDRTGIRQLINYLISNRVKSILVMGSTGEFTDLSNKKRLEAIEIFAEESRGRLVIFANVTGDTERETLQNIKEIEEFPHINAIVLAPLYYLKSNGEISEHMKKVKSSLPLVLYNNPAIHKVKGRNIQPKIVQELKNRIIAVKDSSGDLNLLESYAKVIRTFQGDESQIAGALKAGAEGAVSSIGNILILPQLIFSPVVGEYDTGRLQSEINKLGPGFTANREKIPAGLKYYLQLIKVLSDEMVLDKERELTPGDRTGIAVLKNLSGVLHDVKNCLNALAYPENTFEKHGFSDASFEEIMSFSDEVVEFTEESYKEKDYRVLTAKAMKIAKKAQSVFGHEHLEDTLNDLFDRLPDREKTKKEKDFFVTNVVNSLTLAKNILAELLPLSRREKREVSLDSVIRSTLHFSGCKDYVLQTEFGKKDVLINTDEAALSRALLNIMMNAYHVLMALPEEKRFFIVKTYVTGGGKFVEISLWDNSEGIPSDVIGRIFDPYVTTKPNGTGLGLAIAKENIEKRCGGTIDVESKPGKWTNFIIRLPITGLGDGPRRDTPQAQTSPVKIGNDQVLWMNVHGFTDEKKKEKEKSVKGKLTRQNILREIIDISQSINPDDLHGYAEKILRSKLDGIKRVIISGYYFYTISDYGGCIEKAIRGLCDASKDGDFEIILPLDLIDNFIRTGREVSDQDLLGVLDFTQLRGINCRIYKDDKLLEEWQRNRESRKQQAIVRFYTTSEKMCKSLTELGDGPRRDTPQVQSPPIKEKNVEEENVGILRDLRVPEELGWNLGEAVRSMLLSGKKVVLAFDEKIGGWQSAKLMEIFDELKKDKKFKTFLENLIIEEGRTKELPKKLEGYIKEKNSEIFVFSLADGRGDLERMESNENVYATYINESSSGEYSFSNVYYPLAEIVTLALLNYYYLKRNNHVLKMMPKAMLEDLNIKAENSDEARVLIFSLLDPPEKYDKQELIQRYANLKKFVESA